MTLLSPGGEGYPPGLMDLEKPPPIYVRGSAPSGVCVAVVGTRRCTRYGLEIAGSIGRRIAAAGWVTASGLARGIDAAAHRGTVEAGGRGVAILGSGLDHIYPRENASLAGQLIELGGALVSEYPGTTPPDRWRFPARNRLIAAMSLAVVVVESKLAGGAQITAVLAAEMGRPVFAVPGDIGREASEGTNQLIRDGAIPILGAEDLIAELSLLTGTAAASAPSAHGDLPESGVDIEDLPELWDCSIKEALARLGRLEIAGEVVRSGDFVRPVTRYSA
ncbi:MAG TPA: DNA-processing protein DprA [Acidimicrobiia bacterium]|nr:DNA-processing protein DprA [Acidimicrobiia bacterium]